MCSAPAAAGFHGRFGGRDPLADGHVRSFGLYAPRNATVLAVLFMAATSVAAAVFLILELDGPLAGVITISSGPLRYTLSQLGQ